MSRKQRHDCSDCAGARAGVHDASHLLGLSDALCRSFGGSPISDTSCEIEAHHLVVRESSASMFEFVFATPSSELAVIIELGDRDTVSIRIAVDGSQRFWATKDDGRCLQTIAFACFGSRVAIHSGTVSPTPASG